MSPDQGSCTKKMMLDWCYCQKLTKHKQLCMFWVNLACIYMANWLYHVTRTFTAFATLLLWYTCMVFQSKLVTSLRVKKTALLLIPYVVHCLNRYGWKLWTKHTCLQNTNPKNIPYCNKAKLIEKHDLSI